MEYNVRQFITKVMWVYKEYFDPYISGSQDFNIREHISSKATELENSLDLVELADSFVEHTKKLHRSNHRVPIHQPFNIYLNGYIKLHQTGHRPIPQRRSKKGNRIMPSNTKLLKDMDEDDQVRGLVGIFEGLISLARAPTRDDYMQAVAKRYASILRDLSLGEISSRIDIVLQSSRYFPSPSDILSVSAVEKTPPKRNDMPPAADPDCGCMRGWVAVRDGDRSYHEPCDKCDLGRWFTPRQPAEVDLT